jgi:hypothetical protein
MACVAVSYFQPKQRRMLAISMKNIASHPTAKKYVAQELFTHIYVTMASGFTPILGGFQIIIFHAYMPSNLIILSNLNYYKQLIWRRITTEPWKRLVSIFDIWKMSHSQYKN